MNDKIKLTKAVIDKLQIPAPGKREEYFDSELRGYGVRVTSNKKSFFVLKREKGKLTRVTLGVYGVEMTPDEARRKAHDIISQLHKGIDVNAEKRKERVRGITLAESLSQYFQTKKSLKPRTIKTYDDLFRLYLNDWLDKPIAEVSKDMVAKRHAQVTQRGKAAADNLMRTLRAVYNFANELHDDELPQNPVKRLSNTGAWNKVPRRDTVINPQQLPIMFQAINNIQNQTIRDYLLLLLFTGARREEIATLTWKNVDMQARQFTLAVTKNGKPLTLPMSDFIYEIFKSRFELKENDFVFPGNGRGKTGHLVNPQKQMLTIMQDTGVKFSCHDFRRTFASAISGSIVGGYELKRLLNHATRDNDVTAGYVVHSIDTLRTIMQACTDHILGLCKAGNFTSPELSGAISSKNENPLSP